MNIRTVVAATALVVAATLAACSEPETRTSLADVRGQVSATAAVQNPEAAVAVQDFSMRVGRTPTFRMDRFASDLWTIAAVCADSEWLEVATNIQYIVIPTDAIDESMRTDIEQRGYDKYSSCNAWPQRGKYYQ